MSGSTIEDRSREMQMPAVRRQARQLERLNRLLQRVLPQNRFYAAKFTGMASPLDSLEQFFQWPSTTKAELEAALASDPFANCTFSVPNTSQAMGAAGRLDSSPRQEYDPVPKQFLPESTHANYVRVHRTSGTTGAPLYVFDTTEDWQWWLDCWQYVLDVAEVTWHDRALMAFSFGPFIGFWSANDALLHRGAMVIPTGGLSTESRLQMLRDCHATLVCATPTYAMRMVEVAQSTGIDLPQSGVRVLVVAGEPGGSLPAVRERLEEAWGARVVDHAGATEVGPWGYADAGGTGLYVNEAEFIPEFLPFEGATAAGAEQPVYELVLTCLGRVGWPVFRYRTGDLVLPAASPEPRNQHVFLRGGILGRTDDMLIVRGVNVFPSGIENVLRGLPDVAEFRITATRRRSMDELLIEYESTSTTSQAVRDVLTQRLGVRVEARQVPPGTLPRCEGKSRRSVDARRATT